jgi:hypothetical protein
MGLRRLKEFFKTEKSPYEFQKVRIQKQKTTQNKNGAQTKGKVQRGSSR